ncbi:derlin-2.1-like isoform X2 [Macadamia integrifolia]|uniref:derlin-2.1-like isoform X2 n=1 Tax=Macadamia integrifolia TaxID=60698 RepID=UPI001C52763A|nr:derlin-2.1-like isoform X2 [Macadamia integrifolia]
MAQAVEEWYKQMPIITRSYLTAAIVTTVGCSLEIISPYHLYLNPKLVVKQYEFWRLITNFFYFRKMDLDFLFHMFFLARYCKLLEENSFRGRTADFFYMLLFGATVLTTIVLVGGMIPYVSESFAKIIFLSNSLTFMMVSYYNGFLPFFFGGLCMEQAKSLHSYEFLGSLYFHSSLPTMGSSGVFCPCWYQCLGGFTGNDSRSCLLLP